MSLTYYDAGSNPHVVFTWTAVSVLCTGGKLWAALSIPGDDNGCDCVGCTFAVTINKDPT